MNKTPDDHKPTHHHKLSFYALFIILKGTGTHSINYSDYTYKKGSVFTIRKSSIHKFIDSNAQGVLLIFTEDFIIKHLDQNEVSYSLQLFNEILQSPLLNINEDLFSELISIIELLKIEHKKEIDNFSSRIKRSLLHLLITKLFREKTKEKTAFKNSKYLNSFIELQNLVEKQCFENKTVKYYADQMNISTKSLNNIVKSILGTAAKTFISDVLISQIKRLLINTELSNKEIAYEAGFNDTTNFFKFFKSKTNYSPKEFKSLHK